MLSVLAASMFLLAFFVVPEPFARLVGAKFSGMVLTTAGVFVLPVVLGLTWRAVLGGGCEIAVMLAGARLASRFSFPREICAIWTKRIAAAFSAAFFVFFAALALMVASLAGHAIDALPYDFLALISGIAFAMLLSHRQEQVLTPNFAGSLVSAPYQA